MTGCKEVARSYNLLAMYHLKQYLDTILCSHIFYLYLASHLPPLISTYVYPSLVRDLVLKRIVLRVPFLLHWIRKFHAFNLNIEGALSVYSGTPMMHVNPYRFIHNIIGNFATNIN